MTLFDFREYVERAVPLWAVAAFIVAAIGFQVFVEVWCKLLGK